MSSEIEKAFADGYLAGFKDGFATAKQNTKNKPQQEPYKLEVGCIVCGIGKNGEPFGIECQHPDCPMKL